MRSALLVTHTGRPDMLDRARDAAALLRGVGFEVRMIDDEASDLGVVDVTTVPADEKAAHEVEVVLVLGGDGTFLRASSAARAGCRWSG
jgi:NAD+ kinase